MSDSDHAPIRMPSPNNAFSNSAGWAANIAHGEGTGNSVATDVANATDPLNITHDPKSKYAESDAKDDAARNQTNTELGTKKLEDVTAAYHSALGSLDVTTSNEIQAALATGDPAKAAALLEQSKAGTGIYGIRQMNEKQKQLLSVMPGRAQLSPRYNLINAKAGA